jgi:predicted Zn-ribbon and HTH transcriptional regulator
MGNKSMKISQQNQTEYPMKCPDCNSMAIMEEGITSTLDEIGKMLVRPMMCTDCDFQWNEVFVFDSWEAKKPT